MKKKSVIICIILIIVIIGIAVAISYAFINKEGKLGIAKAEKYVNGPRVYFINKYGLGDEVTEGKAIKSTTIYIDDGAQVVEFKKDGTNIPFSKDSVLEEGKYKIIIALGEEKTTRNFKVDNTAPTVSGVKKLSAEPQTIVFENIEDVSTAVLQKSDETPINLFDLYRQNKLKKNKENKYTYEIVEKGTYALRVADAAGNDYCITFKIR